MAVSSAEIELGENPNSRALFLGRLGSVRRSLQPGDEVEDRDGLDRGEADGGEGAEYGEIEEGFEHAAAKGVGVHSGRPDAQLHVGAGS